ncbi:MAG TPA: nitrous oxide reductase accessory protein NosL [Gemmatimonadales bacterium]|nr:nitrous oxide reductase accessory protein NosL [Gemmatimonadales bacterium]
MNRAWTLGLALGALGTLACGTPGPRPLAWGEEACAHCHMTLADRRFGAEVVTRTGRVLVYDDAGCAANALAGDPALEADLAGLWVVDLTHPDSLLPAASAYFVRSPSYLTPMGSGVAAFPTAAAADSALGTLQGTRLGWAEVLELARRRELGPA